MSHLPRKRLRYIDLFAGIGGFAVALDKLGLECVYANDIDKYCKLVYDKNFRSKVSNGDGQTQEWNGETDTSQPSLETEGQNIQSIRNSSNNNGTGTAWKISHSDSGSSTANQEQSKEISFGNQKGQSGEFINKSSEGQHGHADEELSHKDTTDDNILNQHKTTGETTYSERNSSDIGFNNVEGATYDYNHKGLDTRDVTTIDASTIPDHDLLCGGFPCQSFSIAGKRGGFQDTRGTLFFEIARIADAKRPTYLLLENVKGLLNHDGGRTFETIMRTLDELGYELQWQVLNSKNFGVPQNRERVFIIGHLRGKSRPKVFPLTSGSRQNILETRRAKDKGEWVRGSDISATIDANYHKGSGSTRQFVAQRFPLKFLERNQRNIEGDYAYTLDGANTGGVLIKKITPTGTPQRHRIYDTEGLSPSLTMSDGKGGDRAPRIKIGTLRTHKDGQGFREMKRGISPTIPARAREDGSGQPIILQKSPDYREDGSLREFKDYSPTIRAQMGDNHPMINQDMKVRRLTPLECERLQGFPDNFTAEGIDGKGEVVKISDTQRYKMLGNAVTTNVVYEVAKRLLASYLLITNNILI